MSKLKERRNGEGAQRAEYLIFPSLLLASRVVGLESESLKTKKRVPLGEKLYNRTQLRQANFFRKKRFKGRRSLERKHSMGGESERDL